MAHPDKHGVGGLPGNRVTPLVVSIMAVARALGLLLERVGRDVGLRVRTVVTDGLRVAGLRAAGLVPPVCIGVHALLAEGAERALKDAGARIDIAPLLVPALRACLQQ